jgi:lysophospholipase L1-like esterase
MNPNKRAIARLGLSVFAIVSVLLILETGLRIKGYQALEWSQNVNPRLLSVTNNPELPYMLTPGSSGNGWQTTIAVNSGGFRDREYPVDKGNRFRMVAIGDSITFGSRLAPPSVLYPKKLEQKLQVRSPAPPVDVLNFGVTGYDVANNVEHLRVRALRFQPDIVIVGFCVNDIGTSSTAMAYVRASRYLRHPLFRFRFMQFAFSTGLRIAAESEARDARDIRTFEVVNRSRILPIDGDVELTREIEKLDAAMRGKRVSGLLRWWIERPRIGFLEYAFNRLQILSHAHGFDVVVVAVPFLDDGEKPLWRIVNTIIERESLKYGFHFVDVFDAFDKAGLRRLRNDPADKLHPGIKGHAILATELERYLSSAGLLPRMTHEINRPTIP